MGLRENIWQDNLSQIELREPLIVAPSSSLRRAIEMMRAEAAGCVLICEGKALQGIFTERDFVTRVLAPHADTEAPVTEFMTPEPVTARLADAIGSVIRTMHQGSYRHLPVINDEGSPIGTLSVKRVVQYLVDHFPSAVYNLPPKPRQVQETREGA